MENKKTTAIPATERNFRQRLWATIRLVCYLWMIVVCVIIRHYAPVHTWIIDPIVHIITLCVGYNVGNHSTVYFPRRPARKV
jgi:hypothetical protein